MNAKIKKLVKTFLTEDEITKVDAPVRRTTMPPPDSYDAIIFSSRPDCATCEGNGAGPLPAGWCLSCLGHGKMATGEVHHA